MAGSNRLPEVYQMMDEIRNKTKATAVQLLLTRDGLSVRGAWHGAYGDELALDDLADESAVVERLREKRPYG